MDKEVKFRVLVKIPEMYEFLIHHSYRGVAGVAGTLISILALILFIVGYGESTSQRILLLLVGLLFTVINPIQLYFKAVKQVKLSKMFQQPLDYIINQEGIKVSQGNESMQAPWNEVKKVIETRQSFIIYMSKVGAYILSKQSIDDKYNNVKAVLKDNLESKVIKLK
jgi:multisubunit Na+/H+ antiporter MnhG subunit